MRETAWQLVIVFFGSMSFALLFHLRAKLLPWAALGGLLCWGCYLVSCRYIGGVFFPCLLASAFAELYAEVQARVLRAPSTLFYIPAVIPLVPGGSLFQTMSAVARNDWAEASAYGTTTGISALAISIGMSLVWALVFMIREAEKRMAGTPEKKQTAE